MGNSCTSVFPNTCAWQQQDWNKTIKQRKKVRRGEWLWKEVHWTQKKSPVQSLCQVQSRQSLTTVRLKVPNVVWRWLLCRQLYTMCILRELATAISVQVTSVRWWDWSNTGPNAYGMVSLHGAIVKIIENREIVNVYLQELCYILLVMNLWGITIKCMVNVGSLYLYTGPTSVTETVRLIVLQLNSYTICFFADF